MEKTLIKIEDLERLALEKEDENYRFRRFLKNHADEEELDKQFKRLHEKYFKLYDCSLFVSEKPTPAFTQYTFTSVGSE